MEGKMSLYRIPISPSRGTYFDFNGLQIFFSALRLNPYLGGWILDMSWLEGDVEIQLNGLVLTMGVDVLAQYDTPLPNLLVLNKIDLKEDISSMEDVLLFTEVVDTEVPIKEL